MAYTLKELDRYDINGNRIAHLATCRNCGDQTQTHTSGDIFDYEDLSYIDRKAKCCAKPNHYYSIPIWVGEVQ